MPHGVWREPCLLPRQRTENSVFVRLSVDEILGEFDDANSQIQTGFIAKNPGLAKLLVRWGYKSSQDVMALAAGQ